MGKFFQQTEFSNDDFKRFHTKAYQQLEELKSLLSDGLANQGKPSIGAELELYLVDQEFNPVAKNQTVINEWQNPQLQEELNQYNIEFNCAPVDAEGKPFAQIERELLDAQSAINRIAAADDCSCLAIGILPTLQQEHISKSFMTDLPRYHALTHSLSKLRGCAFNIDINGQESIQTECNEVTLEGANTSFQLHLKVPSSDFARFYNCAQMITPLAIALAANSPIFMGKKLWQETRIALFKQSIDSRMRDPLSWRHPSRVCFGQGWLRNSGWELFAENLALYPPIIPLVSGEPFAELNLHQGTVWNWNRGVFDYGNGQNSHMRIEFRSLAAGPTVIDMMANAALLIGLTYGLEEQVDDLIACLPFRYAEYNFYRAAQHGLAANILWPSKLQSQPTEKPVYEILEELLPVVETGLTKLAIHPAEINRLMTVLTHRLENKQNGASWQLNKLVQLEQKNDRQTSMQKMLAEYQANSLVELPVSQWRT